jgi:glutamate--cysteine ligase
VHIAREGLARRRKLDRMGGDESHFLNTLERIADSGTTPAEEKLGLFNGRWGGSVDPVFTEFAY